MRIIIVGAGTAGRHLATGLCKSKHDVVLVDIDAQALEEAETQLDLLAIQGDGANPAVLGDAGIAKSHLLVAVTNRDDTNILACIFAHSQGVPHTVARVENSGYTGIGCGLDLKNLGVDLIVNEKQECAREIANILRMPGILEAIDLFDGALNVIGFKLPSLTPLSRNPIDGLEEPEIIRTFRFVAVRRGQELIIPRGDTLLMIGDEVYVSIRPQDIPAFLRWALPESTPFSKVVIAGGNELGVLLAKALNKTEMRLVLLESDSDRAHHCAERLDRALVIKENLLDYEALQQIGVDNETAYVAVTDGDENNMISCMMATKLGAEYTLAQIHNSAYLDVIDSLSILDRAVLPQHAMINAIFHFVRGKHVSFAAMFHDLPGELLVVDLRGNDAWVNRTLKEIKPPKGSILVGVLRNGEIEIPTGDLLLSSGDRIVLFSSTNAIRKINRIFQLETGFGRTVGTE